MSDLRSKKKLATYHALATAARTLTTERGPDAVTVEEIADLAGVSPRTFFNYFSCKEEAIVGSEPRMITSLAEHVEQRPAEEDPLTALEAVLASEENTDLADHWRHRVEALESVLGSEEEGSERAVRWKQRIEALEAVLEAEEDSDLAQRWKQRMDLARRFPQLLPRHLAGVAQLERALAEAVASRLGVDASVDPYPRLVVAAAVASMRSTIGWWLQSDRNISLPDAIHQAFEMLRSGLGHPSNGEDA
ncbi:MAG: TetR family transcriptional regulator [Acidimicrobiia bacterium]